jgi:hypothetical protein
LDTPSLCLGAHEGREKQAGKERDNRDDHQQLNQREAVD